MGKIVEMFARTDDCSPVQFNNVLLLSLKEVLNGHRYTLGCHMTPQTDFVQDHTASFCTHRLHFENLTPEFNALMTRLGYPLRLNVHVNDSGHVCPNLTLESLWPETRELAL